MTSIPHTSPRRLRFSLYTIADAYAAAFLLSDIAAFSPPLMLAIIFISSFIRFRCHCLFSLIWFRYTPRFSPADTSSFLRLIALLPRLLSWCRFDAMSAAIMRFRFFAMMPFLFFFFWHYAKLMLSVTYAMFFAAGFWLRYYLPPYCHFSLFRYATLLPCRFFAITRYIYAAVFFDAMLFADAAADFTLRYCHWYFVATAATLSLLRRRCCRWWYCFFACFTPCHWLRRVITLPLFRLYYWWYDYYFQFSLLLIRLRFAYDAFLSCRLHATYSAAAACWLLSFFAMLFSFSCHFAFDTVTHYCFRCHFRLFTLLLPCFRHYAATLPPCLPQRLIRHYFMLILRHYYYAYAGYAVSLTPLCLFAYAAIFIISPCHYCLLRYYTFRYMLLTLITPCWCRHYAALLLIFSSRCFITLMLITLLLSLITLSLRYFRCRCLPLLFFAITPCCWEFLAAAFASLCRWCWWYYVSTSLRLLLPLPLLALSFFAACMLLLLTCHCCWCCRFSCHCCRYAFAIFDAARFYAMMPIFRRWCCADIDAFYLITLRLFLLFMPPFRWCRHWFSLLPRHLPFCFAIYASRFSLLSLSITLMFSLCWCRCATPLFRFRRHAMPRHTLRYFERHCCYAIVGHPREVAITFNNQHHGVTQRRHRHSQYHHYQPWGDMPEYFYWLLRRPLRHYAPLIFATMLSFAWYYAAAFFAATLRHAAYAIFFRYFSPWAPCRHY